MLRLTLASVLNMVLSMDAQLADLSLRWPGTGGLTKKEENNSPTGKPKIRKGLNFRPKTPKPSLNQFD